MGMNGKAAQALMLRSMEARTRDATHKGQGLDSRAGWVGRELTLIGPGAVPGPTLYRPIHPYHIHLTYAFSFLFHRWETEVMRD